MVVTATGIETLTNVPREVDDVRSAVCPLSARQLEPGNVMQAGRLLFLVVHQCHHRQASANGINPPQRACVGVDGGGQK